MLHSLINLAVTSNSAHILRKKIHVEYIVAREHPQILKKSNITGKVNLVGFDTIHESRESCKLFEYISKNVITEIQN